MSRFCAPRVRSCRRLIVAVLIVSMAQAAVSAQFGIFRRSKDGEGLIFRAPDGRFSLEYPARDWQVLPGAGSVVATIAVKSGEASAVIDVARMNQPLADAEINDLFAQLEAEDIAARHAGLSVTAETPTMAMVGTRRVVIIKYVRPGLRGQEQVVQYTIPIGQDIYRLICTATSAAFPKYEPVFLRMIETFQAPATPGD